VSREPLLRVVVSKKGKVKQTEFRLRPDELGLSLFRSDAGVNPEVILDAVRAAGKRGELTVVEIPLRVFHELGLRLVPTVGGTPDADVNRVHVEARFGWWFRLWLRLRRRPMHEVFNERVAPVLAAAATPVTGGEP
jgi:hypothetical protein